MAAALGALSGLALGGIAGYAGEKLNERHQHEQVWSQFAQQSLANMSAQDPAGTMALLQTPEGKKLGEAAFGKEHAEAATQLIGMSAQANQAANTRFNAATSPGSSPSAQMPNDITGLQGYREKLTRALADPGFQDPAHQTALKSEITNIDSRIKETQHDTEFQQNQQRMNINQQENLQMRQENMQMMGQLHADALASQNQFRQFMEQMDQEKSNDARVQHFNSASANLNTQTKNIAAMLSTATPADQGTVNQLLQQRNAAARALKQQADKYGIDYDPAEFQPLTTKTVPGWLASHTGGMVGGSTTSVTSGEPTAASVSSSLSSLPVGFKVDSK